MHRPFWFALVTSATFMIVVAPSAFAQTCPTSAPALTVNDGQNELINTAVTIANSNAVSVINTTSGKGSIVNDGSISVTGTFVDNTGDPPTGRCNGIFVGSGATATDITNNGSIANEPGQYRNGIFNRGTITTLTNNGQITAGVSALGVLNAGIITTFTNNSTGTIEGETAVAVTTVTGSISTLQNDGTVQGRVGISVSGGGYIANLINSKTITTKDYYSGQSFGIAIENNGRINELLNTGTISSNHYQNIGGGSWGIFLSGNGNNEIGTLTNEGTIKGLNGGIRDNSSGTNSITTLNNLQGSGNVDGALTYQGKLPTNYNVIINSASQFGQLRALSETSGVLNFDIFEGSVITSRRYAGVLQGLESTHFSNPAEPVFDGMSWSLEENGEDIWDLVFTGASVSGTQQSLANTAVALEHVFAQQNAAIVDGMSYSCDRFSAHGLCVSVGGRYTSADGDAEHVSGVAILGARLNDHLRIGGWMDAGDNTKEPHGIRLRTNEPMFGFYGLFNADASGKGWEVRVSGGYANNDMTVAREIFGLSEAGQGTTSLETYGISAIVSYNTPITGSWVLSPYVGARYTDAKADAYMEEGRPDVTDPLSLARLNSDATTFLVGFRMLGDIAPNIGLFGQIGFEKDIDRSTDDLLAIGVDGLKPVSFNPAMDAQRLSVGLGTFFDISATQRLTISGNYRGDPEQTDRYAASGMVFYTAGF